MRFSPSPTKRRRPGLGALDQARQQLVVADAPDQPRAQRDRGQRGIVGGEHGFLGDQLGRRIRRLQVFAVGHRVGGAAFDRMRGAMGDAGRGGVDQPADAVRAAGIDARSACRPRWRGGSSRSCPRRRPWRRCGRPRRNPAPAASTASRCARSPWTWVTPMRVERVVAAAIEADDLIAAVAQAAAQGLAEEPPPPVTRIFMQLVSSLPAPIPPASRDRSWRCGGCRPGTSGGAGSGRCARCAAGSGRARAARVRCAANRARPRPGSTRRTAPASARPTRPAPTSAVRRTSRWVLNTGSTCSV